MILRYIIVYHIRLHYTVICYTLLHIRECHAIIYCLISLGVMQLLGGVASKLYGPHVRRGLTGILRKRSCEQLGNDLRRAVHELICDENFDAGIAPCLRLDFEILALLAHTLEE